MSTGPADGTTEELDKMVVAAARTAATNTPTIYSPQVPPEATFPMIDARSLATALLVYLHAGHLQKDFNSCLSFAEHSANVGKVAELLQQISPTFKVKFDPQHYDAGKKHRSEIWPTGVDTYHTENLLGLKPEYTWDQSVKDHFWRCVEEIRLRETAPTSSLISARNNMPLISKPGQPFPG